MNRPALMLSGALSADDMRRLDDYVRAELAAARDEALEDADRVMADLCQTRGNVPMIAVELMLAVRALKATPPTPLGPPT